MVATVDSSEYWGVLFLVRNLQSLCIMNGIKAVVRLKRDTRLVGHHLLVFLSDGMYDLLIPFAC